MAKAQSDVVDVIINEWNRERPDLDPSGLEVAARVVVLARELERRVDRLLRKYNLAQWSFGVLATLRRAGDPYRLSPKVLAQSTMLSSSAMVNRLDRLENRGFLRRLPNTIDRRGLIVELTPAGKRIVDRVMPERLAEAKAVADLLPAHHRLELIHSLKLLCEAVLNLEES
jgi:DNA-binding MarR family transcriptional regulator